MSVGNPPFQDEDPMETYKKILKKKVRFPKGFDEKTKTLIKKLTKKEASYRLGSGKDGAEGIKIHSAFDFLDFKKLVTKELKPYYVPGDTFAKEHFEESNFSNNKETYTERVALKDDPF